jgi:hypothetical protein
MTTVLIRCDGGPLKGTEALTEGPIPPTTIHITDLTGDHHVYLRTHLRFTPADDTWRYIPSNPYYTIPGAGMNPVLLCTSHRHHPHCLNSTLTAKAGST